MYFILIVDNETLKSAFRPGMDSRCLRNERLVSIKKNLDPVPNQNTIGTFQQHLWLCSFVSIDSIQLRTKQLQMIQNYRRLRMRSLKPKLEKVSDTAVALIFQHNHIVNL